MLAPGSSRRVAGASVVAYAVLTFASLWFVAYEAARGDAGIVTVPRAAAGVAAALFLPLLVGFGVGRWWAIAIAAWLIPSALLAEWIEPPFEDRGEVESGAGLTALAMLFMHPPLLLAGVAVRKFGQRRRGVGREA